MLGPSAGKRLLLLLIVLAVLTGIGARAARLDLRLFWQDEAVAALHVSGHNFDEVHRLYDGRVHSVSEVRALVQEAPGSTLGTTLHNLSVEDAHLSPLFYVFDRLSLEAAGGSGSATAYRLPSAIAGILAIGFAFALGAVLFRSRLGGGILAALVAVSPFHIAYSRQTREYALFAMFVFASSYFLFRAFEKRSVTSWIAYGASVGLAMYADSIFALVIVAHATYALVTYHKEVRVLGTYAVATALGGLAYLPWAINGLRENKTVEGELSWGNNAFPLKFVAEKWLFNTGAVFFDSEFADLRLGIVAAIALAIAVAAIVLVARSSDSRTRTFGFALTLFPIGTFIALDQHNGSHFSTIPRYLTAGWIGLEVIVAGALFAGMSSGKKFAPIAFAFLVLAGTGSAIYDNGQENWWDNNNQVAYQSVARELDATPHPLVLVYDFYELPLMLSRYLNPDASFLFYHLEAGATIPAGTKRAYLVIPPSGILAGLEAKYGDRFRFTNVSPNASNAISTFHTALHHDKTFKAKDIGIDQQPDNALWLIEAR